MFELYSMTTIMLRVISAFDIVRFSMNLLGIVCFGVW